MPRRARLLLLVGALVAGCRGGAGRAPTPSSKVQDGAAAGPIAKVAVEQDESLERLLQPEDEPVAEEPLQPVQTEAVPETLGRRELETGMERIRTRVMGCREEAPYAGTLSVRVTIAPTGSVQSVALPGPLQDSVLGRCVIKAVRAASFPRWQGKLWPSIELSYPFLFPDDGP